MLSSTFSEQQTFQITEPGYDSLRSDPENEEKVHWVKASGKKRAIKALAKALKVHPKTLTDIEVISPKEDEECDLVN
jgi:hypothetical protein